MFSCQRRIQNFLRGGIKFLAYIFLSVVFFSAELIGSKLRNKNMALRGSRVMLPRKFFENLDTVMAVLVLFEQFSRQIFFNFFHP